MKLVSYTLLALGVGLAGCNDSGFSGSSSPEKKKKEEPAFGPSGDAEPDPDLDGNGPTNLGTAGENDVDQPSDTDTDTDFGDFFGDLDDPNLTEEDTSVTFGANEVFHLGDGSFDGSSCKFTVNTFTLSGVKYFFEFQVENDNTRINIAINRVCGVDYPDTNFASLYHNGNRIEQMNIPSGSFLLTFSTKTVDAGFYRIEVESRTGSSLDLSPSKNDADDFIIGDLSIRGSNRITRGDFGAN